MKILPSLTLLFLAISSSQINSMDKIENTNFDIEELIKRPATLGVDFQHQVSKGRQIKLTMKKKPQHYIKIIDTEVRRAEKEISQMNPWDERISILTQFYIPRLIFIRDQIVKRQN